VVDGEQLKQTRRVLSLLAIYQDIEDLVNIGAYVAGTSVDFDLAVQARPRIIQFLQQDFSAPTTMAQSVAQLKELHTWIEQVDRGLRTAAAKKGK
jgi:flagellar biosynthesis/type III secretory pathway ATPase